MGAELGLSRDDVRMLYIAGVLHDIGKILVAEAVLHKPSGLTSSEVVAMRAHATWGELLVLHLTGHERLARIVGEHHERIDGLGYPRGRRGDELDPLSLVLTVADAYTAMTETRAYSRRSSPTRALAEIDRWTGAQFDSMAAQALHRVRGNRAVSRLAG